MKVTIDGREYRANTAIELINQIKCLHWHVKDDATPEEYIAVQEKAYKKMTKRKLRLPKTGTEARAQVMFKTLAEIGAWIYEEE